jgi:tRNA (cmo5U34)-methyltransferase
MGNPDKVLTLKKRLFMKHTPQTLNVSGQKDTLFLQPHYPKPFEFNDDVAAVFDDMIVRSVPGYQDMHQTLLQWVYLFYQPGTQLMDVGCSTGTTIEWLCANTPYKLLTMGIDPSQAMLTKAKHKLRRWQTAHQLQWLCASALDVSYKHASVVLLNYILQFLSIHDRQRLLTHIAHEVMPGSLVFVTEKTTFNSPLIQDTVTRMHEAFKKEQGYSQDEISRKKEALDQVLIPLNRQEQESMFRHAGFKTVEPIRQWHNFVSWVLIP